MKIRVPYTSICASSVGSTVVLYTFEILRNPHTFGTHVRRTLQKFQVKSLNNTILRDIMYNVWPLIFVYYYMKNST